MPKAPGRPNGGVFAHDRFAVELWKIGAVEHWGIAYKLLVRHDLPAKLVFPNHGMRIEPE